MSAHTGSPVLQGQDFSPSHEAAQLRSPQQLSPHATMLAYDSPVDAVHDAQQRRQRQRQPRARPEEGGVVKRSVHRGLTWDRKDQRWRVRISYNGKQLHIGRFKDELQAARAFDAAATQLYGAHAITNFPVTSAGNTPELSPAPSSSSPDTLDSHLMHPSCPPSYSPRSLQLRAQEDVDAMAWAARSRAAHSSSTQQLAHQLAQQLAHQLAQQERQAQEEEMAMRAMINMGRSYNILESKPQMPEWAQSASLLQPHSSCSHPAEFSPIAAARQSAAAAVERRWMQQQPGASIAPPPAQQHHQQRSPMAQRSPLPAHIAQSLAVHEASQPERPRASAWSQLLHAQQALGQLQAVDYMDAAELDHLLSFLPEMMLPTAHAALQAEQQTAAWSAAAAQPQQQQRPRADQLPGSHAAAAAALLHSAGDWRQAAAACM